MEKAKVFAAFIATKMSRIDDMKGALEGTRQEVIDSPGSNKSHSDTSRFQYSNLALGIEGSVAEAEYALALARALPQGPFGAVWPGCFFALKDVGSGEVSYYLFVMEGGGDSFEVDGKEVMTISNNAPLVTSVRGKKKGELARFRERILEVLDVQ